ncbi:MAG: hypothetical protein RBS19_10765 [Bacteroidales bacterium]|nr:hypothetical protein [Bacteroidales bacterium]
MNQKETFLHFFKNMDIVMLENILTDDIYYCGISKKMFIAKLSDVFARNLKIGRKKCEIKKDTLNTNILLYQDGNKTGKLYIADFEGKITGFINENNLFDGYRLFQVYADEQEDFSLTDEDKAIIRRTEQALTEFESNQPIQFNFLDEWLDKYAKNDEDEDHRFDQYPLKKVCVFEEIYDELLKLYFLIDKSGVSKDVLSDRKCSEADIHWYYRNIDKVRDLSRHIDTYSKVVCDNEFFFEYEEFKFKIQDFFILREVYGLIAEVEYKFSLNAIN